MTVPGGRDRCLGTKAATSSSHVLAGVVLDRVSTTFFIAEGTHCFKLFRYHKNFR